MVARDSFEEDYAGLKCLGRALVLLGENGQTRSAYQGFLTHWKDADADIPVFQQARAEYAKL
jgi:hypothetical protein